MKLTLTKVLLLFVFCCFFSTAQAQPARTWKTGQTAVYAAGDDGDLQHGVDWPEPRFEDNGDGTVTDHLTGLVWLKNANCAGSMNWYDALTYCTNLANGSCGLTDGSAAGEWRLPNRKELLSLVDYSRYNPALPQGHLFDNVQLRYYWSATTYAHSTSGAWSVRMFHGYVSSPSKSNYFYVWPVRAGQGGSFDDLTIQSPVFGPIGIVNTIEECQDVNLEGKWCFNQHQSEFHSPGGGINGSDDTYAWDINLNSPVWDSDKNKPVYAIADGVVEENYAGAVNAGGSAGQLLIRHDANGLTWWSGYLHLSNILVNPGDTVTKDDILGQIGSTGTDNNHLHFVVYAGENVSGGLISFDAGITANGTMLEFAVNDFASLFTYSWEDYLIGLLTGKESISGIVQNCLNDPDYTSDVVKTEDFNSFIRLYSQYYSQYQKPLRYIWYNDDLTTDIDTIITPFFDATWGDDLNSDSKFNTVYASTSIGDNFEVISRIDDGKTPFDGTENESCYFFTYDSLNDGTASIEKIDRWVDYIEDIVDNYKRSIDTLTIFAHGKPGKISMSDSFAVVSDPTLLHNPPTQEDLNYVQNIEEQFRRLRGKTNNIGQDFLSDYATILLFVCNAGQDETGKSFIKNLANWTGAIVYANTEASGNIQKDGNRITQDWDLDVIGIPDDFFDSPDTNQYTLSIKSTEKKTVMLPNGVSIEIEEGDLAEDGTLTAKNVSDQYSNEADVICAYDISLSSQIAEGNDISVTIPFNSDPANITESGFAVKFWDASSEKWSDEGIWDILINDNYVIFKTNHTTVFAVIKEAQTVPGDLDNDGVVDRTDLNIILSHRNQPASVCPECDLDGDGMITALDARKLVLLCTCPRCVCE